MSDSQPNNSGKLITGLLIGAAIGAALGLLLAPEKGSETRRRMKEKAEDLLGDLKDQFGKANGEEKNNPA